MAESLQEQFVESDSFKLKRFLPWLNLFRAFRLSVGLRVLVLGMLACLLISMGEYAISWMPFSPHMNQDSDEDDDEGEGGGESEIDAEIRSEIERIESPRAIWPWQPGFLGVRQVQTLPGEGDAGLFSFRVEVSEGAQVSSVASVRRMAESPGGVLVDSMGFGHYVLWPARTVIEPAAVLFSPDATWSQAAVACCNLIWALFVWSALAVAIVRIVVLEFANRESPSLSGAIKYSLLQLPGAIGSVILPSVALVGLYLVCRIGGWIAYADLMQPMVGAFWIVSLVCGLGIAVILMLLAAGWPLMVCTMAVDRGDSFEGFTRAFSYVFGRPFYALWLLILTALYGSIVFVFVVTVASSAAHLAEAAAGGHDGIDEITALKPPLIGGNPVIEELDLSELDPQAGADNAQDADDEEANDESEEEEDEEEEQGVVARTVGGFWLKLWTTLCVGFVASFFWTSSGIVYLLLRKSVDATPLDEIHEGDPKNQPPSLPLSGIAAAEQREQLAQADTEPPGTAGMASNPPEA